MGFREKLGVGNNSYGVSTQRLNFSEVSLGTAGSVKSVEAAETEEDKNREKWGSKTEFILSCVGFSVGLGNVWRFPYLAYKNGGGAFLLPYIFMLITCGIPLFYMEVAIGQYLSRGPVKCWKAVCPLFAGIGYAMLVVSFLVSVYYNIIITYVLFYLFDSFRKDVPWRHCKKEWNSPRCNRLLSIVGNGTTCNNNTWECQFSYLSPVYVNNTLQKCILNETKRISPPEEYWNHYVLDISDSINTPGEIRWQLATILLLAWIVVYFCMWKGVKSAGKVVYFTATFPYAVLITLLIRGVTLDGAKDGIIYYVKPDFNKLADAKVWAAAATQLFYSLGPAWGSLLTMGSYNRFNNNCLKDAIAIACVDSFTSSLAGLVIFSVLGYMAKMLSLDVADVAKSGPGLAFVVYPEGIQQMPLSPLWAILFFFMLFTLGLDSEFAMMECVITNIIEQFPKQLKKHKEMAILGACIVAFFIGLSCTCQGGMYVLNLFDYQAGGVSLIFIALMEVLTIGWFYGAGRLRNQVSHMIGYVPSFWWNICWCFTTPLILASIFIFALVEWKGVSYGKQKYPVWAEVIGWFMACSSMAMVPLWAIITLIRTKGDSFAEV